jgi:hypothetical protein
LFAQFASALSDRLTIQSSNAGKAQNPTTSGLLGQKSGQQSTHSLVTDSQQPIDCAVFCCNFAVRMLSAERAFAAVDPTQSAIPSHELTSLSKGSSSESIVAKTELRKLFFYSD